MSPANTKAIGDEAERQACAALEQEGYVVCRSWRQYSPIAPGKWISKEADFFNCFDIIAIKPGERIRFIQVTTEEGAWQKKRRKIAAAEPDGGWPLEHMTVEVWISRKKKMVKGMTRAEFLKWKRFDVKTMDDGFKAIARVPYA